MAATILRTTSLPLATLLGTSSSLVLQSSPQPLRATDVTMAFTSLLAFVALAAFTSAAPAANSATCSDGTKVSNEACCAFIPVRVLLFIMNEQADSHLLFSLRRICSRRSSWTIVVKTVGLTILLHQELRLTIPSSPRGHSADIPFVLSINSMEISTKYIFYR
jgi:hypothetical protein